MIKLSLRGVLFILILVWCLPTGSLASSGKEQLKALLSETATDSTRQLYTAYNLFTERGKVHAINYQSGTVIPVGTPVKVEFKDSAHAKFVRIKFTTLSDDKSYTLKFNRRYHPGKTIYDYANLLFSEKTFEEMTAGKTGSVVNAIRRAAVIEGMSKEEVLISYGYPPEHKTTSLRKNNWTYWRNRFGKKMICFDENERAIDCKNLRDEDL